MTLKCLSIDSDSSFIVSHIAEWAERNIKMDDANNMATAIKMLLSYDYILVVINGDAVDYAPLLGLMRNTTNTPIMIMVANFNTENEIFALEQGADFYLQWRDSPSENVASALAHITRKSLHEKPPCKVLMYTDMFVLPLQRNAYIGTEINFQIRQTRGLN